jgi:hypothetical protein
MNDYYAGRHGGGGGGIHRREYQYTEDAEAKKAVQGKDINEFQNFLRTTPCQKFNIKPTTFSKETGKAVFEIDANLANLQHLFVVVADNECVVHKSFDLDCDEISKRDLRLKKVLDD